MNEVIPSPTPRQVGVGVVAYPAPLNPHLWDHKHRNKGMPQLALGHIVHGNSYTTTGLMLTQNVVIVDKDSTYCTVSRNARPRVSPVR